jgi:hypothetical protein
MYQVQKTAAVNRLLPPEALPNSASLNSIAPAGCSGIWARSALLKLSRYSSFFHARITSPFFISVSFLSCLPDSRSVQPCISLSFSCAFLMPHLA